MFGSTAILLFSLASANPPPPPPLPPPPSPAAVRPELRPPGAWERIQEPLDRSTGRILDEPTYQLDRLQRDRDEQLGRLVPQREFDRLQEERERRLRIEERSRQFQQMTDRQRRTELDRREYELFLNAGLSPTALQVDADEQALMNAKANRDQQLLTADAERSRALQQEPGNREQAEAQYRQKVEEIRQRYEQERARILGFEPLAVPATQSAR